MGRAKKHKAARALASSMADLAPDPVHAKRWPWEWVPILGWFIRRRRMAAAFMSEVIHRAAIDRAQKRIAKKLVK